MHTCSSNYRQMTPTSAITGISNPEQCHAGVPSRDAGSAAWFQPTRDCACSEGFTVTPCSFPEPSPVLAEILSDRSKRSTLFYSSLEYPAPPDVEPFLPACLLFFSTSAQHTKLDAPRFVSTSENLRGRGGKHANAGNLASLPAPRGHGHEKLWYAVEITFLLSPAGQHDFGVLNLVDRRFCGYLGR